MNYVDVILPLPLEGTFTYALDDAQKGHCAVGMRVLVPFGQSKTYAAVVVRIHDEKPSLAANKIKTVLSLLDDRPVLLPQQLKLWQWISTYYMAPLGDVCKAALPSGLKAETGYKPKTESFVRLGAAYRNEAALHVALNLLHRSLRQQQAFLCYLQLSHWDQAFSHDGRPSATWQETEVSREELMNVSTCTAVHVKQLVQRGLLEVYDKEVGRLNHGGHAHPELIKPLNAAQTDAYNHVLMQWMKKNVVLLHGVTSSGKTEIYIHLIQKALDEGQQVLYLLPEIALTVQIMQRLQRVFGNRLGIYHSKFSDAERVEIWNKQLSAHPYDVILGARSAVFLPFQRLGLVIVDEEHETSFKQQEPSPRYHARSAAIVLAQMFGAKTLLGTATPSMESYYNATAGGKYGLVKLTTRYQDIQLPQIEVVDIKDLRRRKMMNGPFSPQLLRAVREALAADRQVILFQNRRGFAPMIECKVCGWVPRCPNCDVSLTLHKRLNLLTCHYCGHTAPVPVACPNCGNPDLTGRGYGTEKIEDHIRELFPEARVARMDLDTTRTRNAYERLIGDFSRGKTNLLIGTQMVSKGLDFDRVALVGILDADSMLNYPDFRAYEHAFMMMSQVAGRAGRKGNQGHVILQTRNADLPVVHQVVNHDFDSFCQDLLAERHAFHYPPYYHLVYVYLKHKQEAIAEAAAQEMGALLRQGFGDRVLGPDKPAVARIKALCIRKMIIKLENGIDLKAVREHLRAVQHQLLSQPIYKSLLVYYDVDPL
jgi:primosomal protein N' (replication factor Y)